MRLLDTLRRRFGRFALPYVTEGLIACQVLTYVLLQGKPEFLDRICPGAQPRNAGRGLAAGYVRLPAAAR